MERSVLEMVAAAAAQGGVAGASVLGILKYAVLPIAKVFTVCFMGFLVASKRVNVLQPNGRKLLNGLVFSLLLPCLIFTQLGRAITIEKLLEWWFVPVNIALGAVSASFIGLVVACIIRPPYPYFKFTIIHIGIGNIGNIPLVLISALCHDPSNPFGDSSKCNQDGNAYISFGQWVGAIIVYTYVPILSEIVPEKSRTSIFALDKTFESILASFAPPIVGILAQYMYGFKPDGEGGSSSIETDRENIASLAKALYTAIAIPMTICASVYSFLYCSYARDRERAHDAVRRTATDWAQGFMIQRLR